MGTSRSVDEFTYKLTAAGIAIGGAQRDAVMRASIASKQVMTGAIESMTGGDQRLSGARNAKISTGFDVYPGKFSAYSVTKVRGPIMLVEEDTPAHTIRPRGRSRRRGGGRRALKFGGRYATYANHPGTRGRGRWKKARDTIVPKIARREIRLANSKAIARIF